MAGDWMMTAAPTMDELEQDRLWEAFLLRDRSLDGAFVCAVRSTGIYCRPTCPARRPRRSQVRFFGTPEEARSDGYRACLRCLPDRVETDADLAMGASAFIDDHIADGGAVPTVVEAAVALGLTPGRLQRLFKRETGVTLAQYAKGRRMDRFKALARNGESVSAAAYDAGFGSSSRLYENAGRQLGMTPATYRRGGAGAVIRYVVTESALGGLLVAATTVGVCAVKLGDDTGALVAELEEEFPAATLAPIAPGDDAPGNSDLRQWVDALMEYLAGRTVDIDLPLDVLATAFQWRVWRRLQAIPAGETCTYQQMAADLEQPTASRAVGRACATNPVAPIIPCHRAVRKDGGLAGYRWGLERKEALLAMERGLTADAD